MGTRSRKKLTVTPTSSAQQHRAQRAAAKVQARKDHPSVSLNIVDAKE